MSYSKATYYDLILCWQCIHLIPYCTGSHVITITINYIIIIFILLDLLFIQFCISFLTIVYSTYLLQDFRGNWHHGVHRVCYDGQNSFGRVLSNTSGKIAYDRCVGVEQVITSHTGFTGDARWDNYYIGT